jgi:hypothetical protein
MVNAGVMGYLSGHPASAVAFAAKEYAANPEIIVGPRHSHRHDQTIYSVLRVRAKLGAQFNIFNLPNVNARYPFLVAATSVEIVPQSVASTWHSHDLQIYLLIVREARQYSQMHELQFSANRRIAMLFLWFRMVIGRPSALLRKHLALILPRRRSEPVPGGAARR